jgi:glycosyltransferase involved in cell wall biosynthesis
VFVEERQTRIHVGYKTTDAPWGGANNFIRALKGELSRTGRYVFTESMDIDCDILFTSQLTVAPGTQTTFAQIRRFREGRAGLLHRWRGPAAPKAARLVVRAVNLTRHAFRLGLRNLILGGRADRQALNLLNFADYVIFQSRYQQGFFTDHGYAGTRSVVIHNGADPAFWAEAVAVKPPGRVLRFASSTMSARASKRHDLLAKLSDVPGVEVLHFGNWPRGLDRHQVQLQGTVTRDRMVAAYAQCDYFVHPAVKDPCPNAIFEAICSGLPVIYNAGPGSSREIVGPNGFALNAADLGETVDRARAELSELKEKVAQNREYYLVRRATRQYREVFDALAAEIFNS